MKLLWSSTITLFNYYDHPHRGRVDLLLNYSIPRLIAVGYPKNIVETSYDGIMPATRLHSTKSGYLIVLNNT